MKKWMKPRELEVQLLFQVHLKKKQTFLPHLLAMLTHHSHHNSLTLSLPAQNLHLSQIFPTINSSDLGIDSMDFMTGPFLLSISLFVLVFFITLCFFGSVLQIKLALPINFYSLLYHIIKHK